LNVIMVEISVGGSVSAMCHGSGLTNPTLCDIIERVDYVDHEGKHQYLCLKEHGEKFLAAVGAMGLFGILTSVDFRLVKGRHVARFTPYSAILQDGIPRPGDTRPEIVHRFETDAKKFYNEWFWFPGSTKTWVNCWDKDISDDPTEPYPSRHATRWQEFTSHISSVMKLLNHNPKKQLRLFSNVAMVALPTHQSSVYLCDALHFRRGIHNLRCLDVEALIEIPVKGNEPDLDFVRQLWWIGVNLIEDYKRCDKYPVRIALEMRLMGGSKALLAPQYGNKYTCAIEVLSLLDNHDEFLEFAEKLVNLWYDFSSANNARFRLHWGKGWTKIKGVDYIDFLRANMAPELAAFKNHAPPGVWEVFSNNTFDRLFA